MLQMRDRVAEIEYLLTNAEKSLLANAERKLIAKFLRAYPTDAGNHGGIAPKNMTISIELLYNSKSIRQNNTRE